jgi:hypothetical protein
MRRDYKQKTSEGLDDKQIVMSIGNPELLEHYERESCTGVTLGQLLGVGGSEARARIINRIDFESKTFYLRTDALTLDIWAISHRWEDRAGSDTWKVICDGDETYSCQMFAREVSNLQNYLDSADGCAGLWLDYICINQKDDADKCEQVGLMGSLYLGVVSLVVGASLAPVLPSPDYMNR